MEGEYDWQSMSSEDVPPSLGLLLFAGLVHHTALGVGLHGAARLALISLLYLLALRSWSC